MAGERFNPSKADRLISEKRYNVLDPQRVVNFFEVEKGDKVADLGAGNGFFTLPIARKTETVVYGVDIEPEMLALLDKRAKVENINNIEYITSDLEDIQLEDDSADKALISFVLHEVPDLPQALSELKRIVKHDGKVLILEWEAVESEMGPPLHERISSEDMKKILTDHGIESEVHHFNEAIYGLKGTFI